MFVVVIFRDKIDGLLGTEQYIDFRDTLKVTGSCVDFNDDFAKELGGYVFNCWFPCFSCLIMKLTCLLSRLLWSEAPFYKMNVQI